MREPKMTPAERRGVKMMKDLQLLAGIDEPTETALKGWRSFSAEDRRQTRLAWKCCCSHRSNEARN